MNLKIAIIFKVLYGTSAERHALLVHHTNLYKTSIFEMMVLITVLCFIHVFDQTLAEQLCTMTKVYSQLE